MDNLEIDYRKAAQQLRSGEALFGKDGALAPLLERILNSALEGEMDAHLSEEERSSGNRRNGKMSKKVQTKYGEVTIETPRDRDGTFQPETVKKRETIRKHPTPMTIQLHPQCLLGIQSILRNWTFLIFKQV